MMKMIRYYEDWKATTECKKFIVYCDRMIQHFKGGRQTEIKYKHNKIYVGSLNKSFKNMTQASRGLNKPDGYVRDVLTKTKENKHKIKRL